MRHLAGETPQSFVRRTIWSVEPVDACRIAVLNIPETPAWHTRIATRSRTMTTVISNSGPGFSFVDGEPMVCEVVQTYLERDGFAVTVVEDGRMALEFMKSNEPDLVILDVMLPEADGLTVLRRLRDHTNVPVILLTAKGEEADRVLGLELGADDHVPKPFSPRNSPPAPVRSFAGPPCARNGMC